MLLDGEPFAEIPPGSSLAALPDIRLDAPGVYRFEIHSDDGTIKGVANPVLVEDAPARRIYWGDTHGHSGFRRRGGHAGSVHDLGPGRRAAWTT